MRNGKIVIAEVGVGPLGMSYGALVWTNSNIHMLMFEPLPEYYNQNLVAANGRTNVELYNVAIGDENGRLKLYNEGTSSSLEGVASPFAQHHKEPPESKPYVEVDVRRISEFDKGDIDILRLDTEGNEWFCLKHLISRPKQIVVETYNDLGTYINPYLFEICKWAESNVYKRVAVADSDFIYERQ
mgnify:CR=1 FL=1